jgi:hypothetical protein
LAFKFASSLDTAVGKEQSISLNFTKIEIHTVESRDTNQFEGSAFCAADATSRGWFQSGHFPSLRNYESRNKQVVYFSLGCETINSLQSTPCFWMFLAWLELACWQCGELFFPLPLQEVGSWMNSIVSVRSCVAGRSCWNQPQDVNEELANRYQEFTL